MATSSPVGATPPHRKDTLRLPFRELNGRGNQTSNSGKVPQNTFAIIKKVKQSMSYSHRRFRVWKRRRVETRGSVMVRLISSLFLLLVFSAGSASAQTRVAQFKVNLDQIPVRVGLDQAFQKIEINKPATLTATLKDVHGATVPARKEHRVQLHYQGQVMDAVIPPGKTSATFQVIPKTAGIEKIEISVSDLA